MSLLCRVVAGLLVAGLVAYWALTPGPDLLAAAQLAGRGVSDPTAPIRLAGFLLSLLPLALLVYGLEQASRCFARFAGGSVFSSVAAGYLWRFSLATGVSALLQPLAAAALSVLLSWNGPPGSKTLVLGVGSDTLVTITFAGTVAVMSWVLREAAIVAEEHSQFV